MPIYEYICGQCRKKFSEVLTIKEQDKKRIHCPQCKSEDVDKVTETFRANPMDWPEWS